MDTERRLERYRQADLWPAEEALAAMLDNQQGAFVAVRAALPPIAAAVDAAAARLGQGAGRLVYAGAGASARLAVQDGVELYPTFGWPHARLAYLIAGGERALVRSVEGAEDDEATGRAEVERLGLGAADVLITVAASGTTRYTNAVQDAARSAGALTISMACNPATPLLLGAEHPLLLHTGPEFLAGSTRMTAGTAQKIALNLLSTQLMTSLGRVYDGYMVNVVTANAKLVARAHRIVETLSGADAARSAAAYEAAGGDIRLAVLTLDGLSLAEARSRLDAGGGDLRRVRPR